MSDGPDGQIPRRHRDPDSIWERYLTGKLSLEDNETLPALIKELHQEIAQHLGHKADAEHPYDVEPKDIDLPPAPPSPHKPTPIVHINVHRHHVAKRRRIDPRQN
jgi:hypothetical protein